jgi:three-Cys-motif partner protein
MKAFELPEPQDDGLVIADVGPWSRDKHHFLRRYLHAFTEAMKNKGWDSLHYIDLFAGAGIERVKDEDKVLGLDWGSPLVAAQLPNPFRQLHLVEKDTEKCDTLRKRLKKFPHAVEPQIIEGDANLVAGAIVNCIPQGALSVAFLDPYGLHLHFETLRLLSQRKVDLIIFFPDHLDALRNWEVLYGQDRNSNLDRVLGNAPWREKKQTTPPDRWADMLTEIYVEMIKTLEYKHFEYERIYRADNRPLYRLIFSSRDKAGVKIWRNTARKKPSGQTSMDFGDP